VLNTLTPSNRIFVRIRKILAPLMSKIAEGKQKLLWEAAKITNNSAERNRKVIAEALVKMLPKYEKALGYVDRKAFNVFEVASGTGQHCSTVSAALEETFKESKKEVTVSWQPSELTSDNFKSIDAWAGLLGVGGTVASPIKVDASAADWAGTVPKSGTYDVVFNANCIHIAPWNVAQGILRGSRKVLRDTGLLIMYGPYAIDGKLTPESNVKFDKWLKARDERFGTLKFILNN
jgi:hypothetical protein